MKERPHVITRGASGADEIHDGEICDESVPAGATVAAGANVDAGARVLPGARVATGARVVASGTTKECGKNGNNEEGRVLTE